jgi:signal transduction histidine kinase
MTVAGCKDRPSSSQRTERNLTSMAIEPIRDAADQGQRPTAPVASFLHSPASTRPLDESLDAEEFERRLLAQAMSAEGGGASRAWILGRGDAGAIEVARAAPAGSGTGAAGAKSHEALAACTAIAEAWRDARVVWSRESGPGTPWSDAAEFGVVTYRLARGAARLLVAAWDRATPGAEERFIALADRARPSARAFEAREGWRRSGEQRAALVEWLRAASASHHLSEGLRAGARAALRISGAQAVAIWTLAPGASPVLAQTAGESPERESLARALQPLAVGIAEGGAMQVIERGSPQEARLTAGLDRVARAMLLPVTASGRVTGVLAALVLAGHESGPRDAVDDGAEMMVAVADGLGMLFDRAARAEAQRAGEQQVRELRARLRRRERLATVGERAAGALAEARHPLASIGAFARRAHREFEPLDPRREYLEVILRESERLERLIAESSEPAAPELSRLRLESLNAVLQDVLPGVGEKLVRRRVRLLKRLDPESPQLLLDVERIRQVFRNVIERAVDSVPVGGRVRIESRLVRDHVIAEIAFDGGHAPGDLLEELFVPFTPGAAHGAPGLGVADRVIRQHGGEIRVRADGEWGATVLITLPVQGNEERRRTRSDRRLTRSDRRLPAGPA